MTILYGNIEASLIIRTGAFAIPKRDMTCLFILISKHPILTHMYTITNNNYNTTWTISGHVFSNFPDLKIYLYNKVLCFIATM